MHENFTNSDLIRYFYNEVSAEEKQEISKEIAYNPRLRHQYQSLCRMTEQLDGFSFDPDPTTIDIILEHSHSYEHTH